MWGKWIALVVLLAFTYVNCCGPARAQTFTDGSTTTNKAGTAVGGQTPGAGATKKSLWWVDANGVGHVQLENADPTQFSSVVVLSAAATPGNKGYTALSNPYMAGSSNAWKWVRVTTASGTANSPWKLQFLGSPDGVTYGYLAAGASGSLLGSSTPTFVESDTLEIRGHGPGTWWVPLEGHAGYPIIHPFLQCRGVNDTAAAAFTFTVEISGRQH